ncbi:hypothetical protein BJ875DRAFT_207452 [Amylocarpus encephaloides]|uniref:Uncharacterized protein n=1 Tax=Amylocarpus encephaloides TaxID=45428 RepID=A0A9P7Y857_9HELO|nr:hypothetical protein BJ875DRAFT_207452 [Amylocarpus encephaloides]
MPLPSSPLASLSLPPYILPPYILPPYILPPYIRTLYDRSFTLFSISPSSATSQPTSRRTTAPAPFPLHVPGFPVPLRFHFFASLPSDGEFLFFFFFFLLHVVLLDTTFACEGVPEFWSGLGGGGGRRGRAVVVSNGEESFPNEEDTRSSCGIFGGQGQLIAVRRLVFSFLLFGVSIKMSFLVRLTSRLLWLSWNRRVGNAEFDPHLTSQHHRWARRPKISTAQRPNIPILIHTKNQPLSMSTYTSNGKEKGRRKQTEFPRAR